jgi:protein TonB
MAYFDQPTAQRRTAVLGTVAALHAGAIYLLLTGFAVTIWDKVDAVLPARSYPAEPPPPPPEPSVAPSPEASVQPLVAPKPAIDLDRSNTTATVIDLLPLPSPTALPSLPAADPIIPSPTPSFIPAPARPLGDPGRWATSDDYPARALREERQGTTRFRVTVGAHGRVRNCEIVASSGSPDLDAATCANVARRARFTPATDATGARVSGSYSNAVRWEIPG